MKNYYLKIFVAFVFLSGSAFSQTLLNKIIYYEELSGQFCSEHLRIILDGFFVHLQNNPDAKGLVVFHGKEGLEGQVYTLQKILRQHTELRRFNPKRFETLRSGNKDETTIKLWVIPKEAGFQKPQLFAEKSIDSATRFDKGFADLMKQRAYNLKTIRYSGAAETCDIGINFEEFSKVLLSNPDLTGVIVIYNSKKSAEKIARVATDKLNKKYQVPKNRLKVLYKEKREEPEMELWFVPKGIEIKDSDFDKIRENKK